MLANFKWTWPAFGLIVTGLFALAGAALGLPIMQTLIPNSAPLQPFTASCFLVAGVAFLFGSSSMRSATTVTQCLAWLLVVTALTRLVLVLLGQQVVFFNTNSEGPSRFISAVTCAIALVGAGILASTANRDRFVGLSAAAVGALALFALSGYAFSITGRSNDVLPISVPGTLGFMFSSIGLILSGRDSEFIQAFTSPRTSGIFARFLIPFVLAVPLAIGLMALIAEESGLLKGASRSSVEVALTGLVLVAIVWAAIKQLRLNEADAGQLSDALANNISRLRLLHAVASDPTMTFREKAQSLLEQVRSTLDVEVAVMMRADKDILRVESISPNDEDAARSFVCEVGNPLCSQILLRDGPLVLDASQGTTITLPTIGKTKASTVLAQRLIVDGDPYGILLFASTERAVPFSPDDLDQIRLTARWLEFELNAESSQRALRASEERFKNLATTMPGMVFQFERRKSKIRFTYISDGSQQLFGVSAKFLMTDPSILRRMSTDTSERQAVELLDRAEAAMSTYHHVREFHTSQGEDRWVETFARPQRLDDDCVVWTGVALDISEQRALEQQLDAARERLGGILSSMDDVIFSLTPDGRQTIYVSEAASRLLGHPPKAFLEDHDLFVKGVHEADRLEITFQLDRAAKGTPIDNEVRYFLRDGRMLWLRVRAHLVRSDKGEPLRVDGITTDVTRRKTSEMALLAARAEAEKANAAKSEFLSRMSHELRTPMNAILGFAQLLELEQLSIKQRDSIEHILKAGRHLLELVNEVLDISRIESGTLAMSLEPVELLRAVRESVALVRPIASSRQITIRVEDETRSALHVTADRQRLRQVFLNLLSNAIKYSPVGGTVVIRMSIALDRAIVDVSDEGPGLQAAQIERLFTPFDRLGAETTGIEGTGLGLPLAKRLMEGMGGALEVRSVVHRGSTFSAILDIAVAPAADGLQEANANSPDTARGPREVLLIEDNLSNVRLIEEIIKTLPQTTLVSAMQGRLGLDLAREHPPSLILLDINLPDVNGLELLTQIRAEKNLSEVPVIILSADATARQIEKAKELGANAYLTKPFILREFIESVTGFLSGGN